MLPVAIVKGVIMAALILGVAEAGFLQAVAVAACSASITGLFLVIASYVQARHTGAKIDEVKDQAKAIAEQVDAPIITPTPPHPPVEGS
jgi:hypothetical protein